MPAAMFAFYFSVALLLSARYPNAAVWALMVIGSYLAMRSR